MRLMICLTMLCLTGCGIAPNDSALCDVTARDRTALADALVADGGIESRRAGLRVIEALDAGCGQ